MHPHLRHHIGAEGATRLGDFVLMMREDEIDAAAMDVERLAQMPPGHGGALDMPAGASPLGNAAGRRPAGTPSGLGFHSTKSMGSRL